MIEPDAELLRRYADERCEEAFAELVRRYIDLVYHAALRQLRGDGHRAQDVSQAVFALVARKAHALSRHAALAGWLHTTTRLTARRMIRTEQRRWAREQEAHLMPEDSPETRSTEALWLHVRPMIDEVLGELGDTDRTAVLLRFFAGLPLAEVGAKLGIGESAARMRVERALDKLRTRLARRGISSTGAALGMALTHEAAVAAPAGLAASVVATTLGEAAHAGALAAVIAFMTATKTTIALGILAAVATVTALYQTQQTRAAVASLDVSRSDLAALRREGTNLSTQATAEEDALATAQAAARDSMARTAARETAANQAAPAAALEKQKADQALQQFLAADPQLQQLKREHRLQTAIRLLLPFGLSFGLTAEELEQVAAEFNRWGPVYLPIHPANLEGMPKRLANDPRFIEAWQISDTRFTVENFNMRLWEPLNATQAGRLIQSIQSARPNPIPPDGYNYFGIQRTANWAQVLAEAGDYLSPSQLSALRGFAASARTQALLALAAKQPRP